MKRFILCIILTLVCLLTSCATQPVFSPPPSWHGDMPEGLPTVEEHPDAQEVEPKRFYIGDFRLTAYCSCFKCCDKWALNRPKDENGKEIVYGASGVRLVEGVSIAVDPAVIPYGTVVEFDGKTWIAHDTGGAIKGARIDVYFESHERALKSGMTKTVPVYIVG